MYRVPVLERFAWQEPVLAVATSPTSSDKGDRFLVSTSSPTGDFSGQGGKIAWHDGSSWNFDNPQEGWKVYNKDDGKYWTNTASGWTDDTTMGDLNLSGDINSEAAEEMDWILPEDTVDALSFGSALRPGILAIDTTSLAGAVRMAGDLIVTGDMTIQGEITSIESTQLTVEDPIFTLNKGGTQASAQAAGVGMEVETDGSISGYIKSSVDLENWLFNAPGNAHVLTLDVDATATLNIVGNLTVEAESFIDQDLTQDAVPSFAGLDLNGNLDITSQNTIFSIGEAANSLSIDSSSLTGIIAIDSTVGSEKVSLGRDLYVAGASEFDGDMTFENGATLSNSTNNTLEFNDGVNSITVEQARKSFDSRAKWDAELEVIVFNEAMLDDSSVTP